MRTERSGVKDRLWRKKIDGSIFESKGTVIPLWVCDMWHLRDDFNKVTSKNDPKSKVAIEFGEKEYQGEITVSKKSKSHLYRLHFHGDFLTSLLNGSLISLMRNIGSRMRKTSTDGKEDKCGTNRDLSFWNSLVINYIRKGKKIKIVPHYGLVDMSQ